MKRHSNRMQEREILPFLNSLPTYIPSINPNNFTHAKILVESKCLSICEYFCWTYANAPWQYVIPHIKIIMQNAMLAHLYSSSKKGFAEGTKLKNSSDLSTVGFQKYLPIIPDVTIHYRCGDNVEVPEQYGFLPFKAIVSIIKKHPHNHQYIYILSDPPGRSSLYETYSSPSFSQSTTDNGRSKRNSRSNTSTGIHEFTHKCVSVLKALFNYLQFHFPSSIIILKRGGDPFLDFIRLSYSKVTICSSSTFCIWPAIATNGTAYFPDTTLIANGVKPNFGKNFNWITDFKVISTIRKNTPVEKVIEILQT
jgi:hypothetical protein